MRSISARTLYRPLKQWEREAPKKQKQPQKQTQSYQCLLTLQRVPQAATGAAISTFHRLSLSTPFRRNVRCLNQTILIKVSSSDRSESETIKSKSQFGCTVKQPHRNQMKRVRMLLRVVDVQQCCSVPLETWGCKGDLRCLRMTQPTVRYHRGNQARNIWTHQNHQISLSAQDCGKIHLMLLVFHWFLICFCHPKTSRELAI